MKKAFQLFIIITLLAGLQACNELTVGPEPKNDPVTNFETLWKEYDRMYGLFEVKGIDWRDIYNQYRPLVNSGTTTGELFTIISGMLGQLNDGHVWMISPGPDYRRYDSGISYPSEDFSLPVVRKYLETDNEIHSKDGVPIIYGRLPGNIGYLYLEDLAQSPSFYEKEMNKVIPYLSDTRAVIVDARSIEGGDDRSAQQVAGRFALERTLYMTSRFRNGHAHTDFTSARQWFVEPTGKSTYTKPVILLTNRTTGSAGETFTLAMRAHAHVRQLGDTTNGIFSENPRRELPNGWIYTISVGDYRTADGKSLEGIGIAPQTYLKNSPEDILAGRDKVLEAAMNNF